MFRRCHIHHFLELLFLFMILKVYFSSSLSQYSEFTKRTQDAELLNALVEEMPVPYTPRPLLSLLVKRG